MCVWEGTLLCILVYTLYCLCTRTFLFMYMCAYFCGRVNDVKFSSIYLIFQLFISFILFSLDFSRNFHNVILWSSVNKSDWKKSPRQNFDTPFFSLTRQLFYQFGHEYLPTVVIQTYLIWYVLAFYLYVPFVSN